MVDATTTPVLRALLPELFRLLDGHRSAFGQERPYQRSVALLLGWVCAFGRHTLTQVLLALGLGETDWTAFYRLFSRGRVDYERLARCLLAETLAQAPADTPYLVGIDATQIPRHSRTMPGTSWLRHLGTALFRAGIHRTQRFVHLSWLPLPSPAGYSRAVPLRFDPAFPAKAVPAPGHPPAKEWEAGLAALTWLRQELDGLGRSAQLVLGLGDGSYSTAPLWAGLPARVVLLARCAKNRALYALPRQQDQPARRRGWPNGPAGSAPRSWCGSGPFPCSIASMAPVWCRAPRRSRSICWSSKAPTPSAGTARVQRASGWSRRCQTTRVGGACPGRRSSSWPGPGNAGNWRWPMAS
jgi:hypothetical protein